MNQQASSEITIAHKYRGPAESGNGGYVCGAIAECVDGDVEVTLLAPPPLDQAMQLHDDNAGIRLMLDEQTIAAAKPVELEIDVPDCPPVHAAACAHAEFVHPKQQLLPECFVCGPLRLAGDGLRLFTGPLADQNLVASTWSADAQYCDADGVAWPRIIWAALDCPGYFGLQMHKLALLGRLAVQIDTLPVADQPCIVAGWHIGSQGRKHYAGSALYDAEGKVMAFARATWIELNNAG